MRYWLGIVPLVRRELCAWTDRAQAIPDDDLREHAVTTLADERLNVEAAAVFATLVPRTQWRALVPLLVAFQVMYDYLDTVSEEPVGDWLRNGLQLHRSLLAALDPPPASVDYYAFHPQRDDGGYLHALAARCRAAMETLAASEGVLPLARRAAERCRHGQSRTHAAVREGDAALAGWARSLERAERYHWWELAAGAISSVGLYALLAAAADPRTTRADAARVDAAYFPPVCALSTLLDSFVDREADRASANPSTYARYTTAVLAAERIALIARRAATLARGLRHGERHVVIVSGIAAYYLSADDRRTPEGRLLARELRASLGAPLAIILATMRLRRRIRRRRGAAHGGRVAPLTNGKP